MNSSTWVTSRPVLIVGAGPVGLTLANLLGRRRIPCVIFDKHESPATHSRAIGITPPSLDLFRQIGVVHPFLADGVRITKARVHDDRGRAGNLTFDRLPGEYRFILTMPQARTVQILEKALAEYPSVRIVRGTECVGFDRTQGGDIRIRTRSVGGEAGTYDGSFLIGCDGRHSTIREAGEFKFSHHRYANSFVMADYEDASEWGNEAHLFFTRRGSLEAFPLPGRRRRWVAMLPAEGAPDPSEWLEQRVVELCGSAVLGARVTEPTTFWPERLLARRLVKGRVILAGDAAHVMSPIGGQGMNTGLKDAEQLSLVFSHSPGSARFRRALRRYTKERRGEFRVASRRAAAGMWLGTRIKPMMSRFRGWLLRWILLRKPVASILARHFAMVPRRFSLRCRDYINAPESKRTFNQRLFTDIAHEYPIMTRVLSWGRDAVWKRNLIRRLPEVQEPTCVDLACGNGDLTVMLSTRYPQARVIGVDLTEAMIEVARKRMDSAGISFVCGDMARLPLADRSVDLLTVSYGLRNAPVLLQALDEIARVMKPGSTAGILEFARWDSPAGQKVQLAALRLWGKLWGLIRTGNCDTYGYIADSLARFATRSQLRAALSQREFGLVSQHRCFFGMIDTLTVRYEGRD